MLVGGSSAAGARGELDEIRPQPVGRNQPCPCGSGSKYKKCCLLRERRETAASLPAWAINSSRKLQLFLKYATKVYSMARILGSFTDNRRNPIYPTFDVVNTLFHAALFRRPSINATEGDLKQTDFQKLIGRKPKPGVKAFSAEVISNVLDKLNLDEPLGTDLFTCSVDGHGSSQSSATALQKSLLKCGERLSQM